MEINKELIGKIAKNAKLELTEQEKEEFLPQLKEVLEDFSKIEQADTSLTTASFQPLFLKNVDREDKVKESLTQEQALQNTKHKKDGFFRGPKAF